MNEKRLVGEIKKKHGIPEGSTPRDITTLQQRGALITGRLIVHAHRRGKRKNSRWI